MCRASCMQLACIYSWSMFLSSNSVIFAISCPHPDKRHPVLTGTSHMTQELNDRRVQGGEAHIDIPARKLCIVALSKMLASWVDQPDFKAFAIHSIGVRCCLRGLCSGSVDIRDGGALGILNKAANTLCALHVAYGEDFLEAARSFIQQEEQAQYAGEWGELLAAAAAEDVKRSKDAYKALLRRKQARGSRIKGRIDG
jgi:hypothetical protein